MKLKLLLFLSFMAGILNAQVVCEYPAGVITSLVISEVRMTSNAEAFIEITNMGTEPVNLKEFKLGRLTPWVRSTAVNDLCNDPWNTSTGDYMFLPDRVLLPGKSFVLTNAYNYWPIHYLEGLGRLGGNERPKQTGIYEVANKLIHVAEAVEEVIYPRDSITTSLNDPEQTVRRGDYSLIFSGLGPTGQGTFFLEHHYAEGDSAIVDQVGGVFDNAGRNFPNSTTDIAGVQGGVGTSMIYRKNIIKKGNLDFANSRGISLDDSEWIPIELPTGYNAWRDIWWTIGNHGNFTLDANTLEPINNSITVDYANKKITVPWGTLRLDEIMRHMKKKPGVAWVYHLNEEKNDSLYRSARTGDKLTVYVVGNGLSSATFDITVKNPTADDNIVVPIDHANLTGPLTTRAQNGILSWPRVTRNATGIDTISGSQYGLTFDLRSDSLLKYLEKPGNASWEIVWVDGVERPDLKNGDKLKVTSQSGKVKEYFIQVQTWFPNRNVNLSAITWPDIPEFYKGFMGWKGDTIPNFSSGTTNYRVEVPMDVEGVPALVAKTDQVNASVLVDRAKSLAGTIQDRTITFNVTAEDDTIKKAYYVELIKEKHPSKIEPFRADPIISEFVNSYPNGNAYLEIYNPGNQPIDLRNYMIAMRNNANLYAPVTANVNWLNRYTTYIPGLKHVDEATWAITPRILIPDVNVNPILQGGQTFTMALITRGPTYTGYAGLEFPHYDMQFANELVPGITNPWGENIATSSAGGSPIPPNGNRRNIIFLYKVLNDSIKLGLKPNTNPSDFDLIDIMGMPNNAYWVVGDYVMGVNETGNIFIRKPEINKGNPVLGGSFGVDNPADVEWIRIQPNSSFSHIPTPARWLAALSSLNTHFMNEPTFYKSTVTSAAYKVSDGFGPKETIRGIRTGTTVLDFMADINKADPGQVLRLKSVKNGLDLGPEALLTNSDTLIVMSADSINFTKYALDVTERGLSANAILTSEVYFISVDVTTGGIYDIPAGIKLAEALTKLNVPAGATMTVIDSKGAYVPLKRLNFDTTYVDVVVKPDIYIEVVAEDGVSRIIYQMRPVASEDDAYIISDAYDVHEDELLIQYVPRGTNFQSFMNNITPSLGASIKLVDKMGFVRTRGAIREDDRVIVSSANGKVTKVYFISFLATNSIPSSRYLAYVLSDSYAVNQVDFVISGAIAKMTGQTLVTEFLSKVTPAMGASVVLVDAMGNEKTSPDLNTGDMLKVTSADGKIIVMYHLTLDLTSAEVTGTIQPDIYPNPTTGVLNIKGIEPGNRIQVYNIVGSLVLDQRAQGVTESISLRDQPAGMYMILIHNDIQQIGQFKAIKK